MSNAVTTTTSGLPAAIDTSGNTAFANAAAGLIQTAAAYGRAVEIDAATENTAPDGTITKARITIRLRGNER